MEIIELCHPNSRHRFVMTRDDLWRAPGPPYIRPRSDLAVVVDIVFEELPGTARGLLGGC